jgi:cell division septation protein DedD
MHTATMSFRAGRLTEAQYQVKVDQFWRRLGVSVAGQPRPTPATPAAPPAAGPATAAQAATPAAPATEPAPPQSAAADSGTSWISQLGQLAQLHDQGVLSDDDYEAAKRRLLEEH